MNISRKPLSQTKLKTKFSYHSFIFFKSCQIGKLTFKESHAGRRVPKNFLLFNRLQNSRLHTLSSYNISVLIFHRLMNPRKTDSRTRPNIYFSYFSSQIKSIRNAEHIFQDFQQYQTSQARMQKRWQFSKNNILYYFLLFYFFYFYIFLKLALLLSLE